MKVIWLWLFSLKILNSPLKIIDCRLVWVTETLESETTVININFLKIAKCK
jgi:hypothetical protein